MQRIERLTPEQIARFPEFVERWVGHGLSTAPTDRPAAEAAIRLAYRRGGIDPPALILWLRSPYELVLADAVLRTVLAPDIRVGDQVGAQVRAQVWAQVEAQVWAQVRSQVGAQVGAQVRDQVRDQVGAHVWDQVWSQVEAQVGDQVEAQVRDQVGDQVRAQVRDQVRAQVRTQVLDQVGDQVRAQVRDQVRDQVWTQVGDQVGDQVWDQVWDQVRDQVRTQVGESQYSSINSFYESGWLAFYAYCREVLGLECCRLLDGLMDLHQCCGWWIPRRGVALLSDRPTTLRRDGQGRLHAEDGPAVGYADGWGVYAWHGVRVPESVILWPGSIEPREILAEPNAEVRRVMLERLPGGHEAFIRGVDAQMVHRDDYGTLWRVEQDDDEPLVVVQVTNSTPEPDGSFKDYWLRVPPTLRRAREAVAWTFGKEEPDYAPALQS